MINSDTGFVLRARPFWEAADTGLLMLRQWYVPALIFFLVPFALIFTVLVILFQAKLPWLVPLVVWWLGPLWDRWVVSWAGERFFQPRARSASLLRRWLRIWDGSLLADLTWRRFSPFNTFLLPVRLFEGVRGKDRQRRRKWLASEMGGPLVLLAFGFLCSTAGVGFSLALTALVALATTPWGTEASADFFFWNSLFAVSVALMQPLHALSCFGLYVNTRTRKEGWDLALAFRTLRKSLPPSKSVVAGLGLVLALTLGSRSVAADEVLLPSAKEPQKSVGATWDQVVERPEFGGHETHWTWKFKKSATDTQPSSNKEARSPFTLSAEALRLVAIVIAVGGVVVLAVFFVRSVGGRGRASGPPTPGTATSPRPVDWERRVEALCAEGQLREAVALLYREALAIGVRQQGLTIAPGATEGDVLRILRKQSIDQGLSTQIQSLTRLWLETAWAGRVPDSGRVLAAAHELKTSLLGLTG